MALVPYIVVQYRTPHIPPNPYRFLYRKGTCKATSWMTLHAQSCVKHRYFEYLLKNTRSFNMFCNIIWLVALQFLLLYHSLLYHSLHDYPGNPSDAWPPPPILQSAYTLGRVHTKGEVTQNTVVLFVKSKIEQASKLLPSLFFPCSVEAGKWNVPFRNNNKRVSSEVWSLLPSSSSSLFH